MDARVSMGVILDAFGVPGTVRRAPPNETPVSVVGAWVRPLFDEQNPVGVDLQRREPRRIFAMAKNSTLAQLSRGDLIDAPEELGGDVVRWRVDGFDQVDHDCWRPIVVHAR